MEILPKHVFANPLNPAICPVLSLALHIFSDTYRQDHDDYSKLFLGNSYDSFSKWLSETLGEIETLGYEVSDFGTHSFWKGAATYCAGFVGGPSVITIFLRAEWSLGQVQDRYLMFADGGDQLYGRIAAGLNFGNGPEFSVLPPRFKNNKTILTPTEWNE